jgi:phosphatidylserine/phosphatidylglycerophosphate/cardiolipin synthase-like enzyme
VLSGIDSAQKSILVAAYSFTSKPISAALLDAHRRGVDVRVVADAKANGKRYTAATYLANHDVPVRLNDKYAILHDKFMVIDGATIETGSFNYTAAAANKNAENVLVLRDMPEMAARYTKEWQRLWDEGVALEKRY